MLNTEQLELVNNNLSLVYYVIHKLKIKINEDIIQEGYLALCKSALNYDKNKSKFSTYAYINIKNSIIKYLKYDHIIKPKRKNNDLCNAEVIEYNDNSYANNNFSNTVESNIYYESFFDLLTAEELDITIKRMDGYKIKEIAKIHNKSDKTIYNKLSIIKLKLKNFKME